MKIEYALKSEDQLTFQKIVRKGSSNYSGLILVIGFVGFFMILINGPTDFWNSFGDFKYVLQIGLFFVGLFILRSYVRCGAVKKFDKDFQNSKGAETVTVHFDDDGITSEQTNQKTIWKWAAFHKLTVENEDIFLWFDNMQALMIPSRAFETSEKKAELTSYLEEKIQQSTVPN